ncbi:MAG: AgmX/PglI C-terminal domain-containing protein [Polyangiaceae bacterium]
MESEIGALDANKVQAVFDSAASDIKSCYERGVARVPFMAGEIKLAIRVSEDGSTKHAFVKDSTLGDRTTESCMLSAVKHRTWPKPQGGKEGTAETSFMFEPGEDERPPVDWTEANMGPAFQKARSALNACRSSAGAGPMRVTLYVETDGKPMAVGIAGNDAKSEEAATCVVDALMGLKLSSPGSYAAKVTVSLD